MEKKIFGKKTKWIIILPLVFFLSFGFVALKDKEFEIVKNLDIFYSLFRELNLYYVDDVKPDKLIESAIDGMLSSLDPYTTYIPESQMENFNFLTTGEYGGIGALIRKGGDYTLVSEPYEGFPAQLNGLRAGDTIYSINGISTKGKEISNVSELLKGTPNTTINLQIKRPGTKGIIEKTITRQKITISNVPYCGIIANNIGYIRLTGFTKDAGQETKDALKQLKSKGAQSIILDLRGNPGGLLIESVEVSNIFIGRDQEIVSTKGKIKQGDNDYKTTSAPVDTLIPLILLVNHGTASAAEIVTGAMQDLDRGVVVGQRTFGKGLVQTTRPLSYNTELKVTTAKYYIPSGRCIQAVDYSHRNPDGSVGFIPDSLIKEFSTRDGRKVFDGGGITPDVHVDIEPYSNITVSLYTKNLIFDYATKFANEHESFPSYKSLKITDEEYQDFLNFLKGKNYNYTSESDTLLQQLIKTAKREKYYDAASAEFAALKVKLAHDPLKDLQTFKDEIKDLLYQEIASRYFYQKGRIEASLDEDPELNKAIEILNNPQLYNSILKGTYKPVNKGEVSLNK